MYTPVKSKPTGSRVDVSDILHDPRNTLAFLKYPSRPVVKVLGVLDSYTVGEDEQGPGFRVGYEIFTSDKKLSFYPRLYVCMYVCLCYFIRIVFLGFQSRDILA
jgi:hypothetical protein